MNVKGMELRRLPVEGTGAGRCEQKNDLLTGVHVRNTLYSHFLATERGQEREKSSHDGCEQAVRCGESLLVMRTKTRVDRLSGHRDGHLVNSLVRVRVYLQ